MRRRTRAIAVVAIALGAGAALGLRPRRVTAIDRARAALVVDLDSLDARIAALGAAAPRATRDSLRAREALAAARIAYKRVEYLTEHLTPVTAVGMNGVAAAHPDDENPRVSVRPTGLQVVEASLYPIASDADAVTAAQARVLAALARRVREVSGFTTITDAQLFDAVRIEIARVVSLGLAGLDAPLARTSVPEARAALDGATRALAGYARETPARARFDRVAARALAYLAAHPDVDSLGYYTFVTGHANPLARALVELRVAAGVPAFDDRRVWSPRAATLFDEGAFDASAMAPLDAPASTPARIALGAQLFAEPALSGRGDRTCATCHVPTQAFTDGRARATSLGGSTRNTPTLLNAALQRAAFADARVAYLEDQVSAVIASPAEMAGNMDSVVTRLASNPRYRSAFAAAFDGDEAHVTRRAVRYALAAYVRSLVALDAPYDRAMRGDATAMSADARRGLDVFMGKGRCGSCHFAPLFGGTVPPTFDDTEVEVIGAPRSGLAARAALDDDHGVGAIDASPLHDRAFKTPSLRNVARTAPYMHDGAFRTLGDVIEFYDRGGGVGIGLGVPNQTLPADSLRLTAQEKRELKAFLESLSSAVR